ncbi:MAG: beta-ketoacyl-ACP synthase 3 [Calditrichaeota bacterium]|nr:beta-ketoacyl-ACP synthase 3 [Calditrichota bacterium]
MTNGLGIGYLGVGRYLPERVLTNADLERIVDTSDEWIVQRTGIKTRRIMGPGESVATMAIGAAREALARSGVSPDQISIVRVGVNTHLKFPSLASTVQDALGISNASASDISAGCSAFIFAVEEIYNRLAFEKLSTGREAYGLAVGVDGLSLITDWSDRATCVLFGDGAGAAVIGPVEAGGILATYTRTQGQYADLLYLDDFLSSPLDDNPLSPSFAFRHRNGTPYPFLHMEGRKVFQVAVRSMMSDIRSVIDRYNLISGGQLTLDDIEYVIPHQANHRIVSAVAEGLKLPPEQVYSEGVVNYGNTSAASIPIGYVDQLGKRPGALEVDVAFGAGFASGAILRRNGG